MQWLTATHVSENVSKVLCCLARAGSLTPLNVCPPLCSPEGAHRAPAGRSAARGHQRARGRQQQERRLCQAHHDLHPQSHLRTGGAGCHRRQEEGCARRGWLGGGCALGKKLWHMHVDRHATTIGSMPPTSFLPPAATIAVNLHPVPLVPMVALSALLLAFTHPSAFSLLPLQPPS